MNTYYDYIPELHQKIYQEEQPTSPITHSKKPKVTFKQIKNWLTVISFRFLGQHL